MGSYKIAAVALWAAMVLAAQAGMRGVPIQPVENIQLGTATPELAERAIREGAMKRGWVTEVVDADLVRCRLDNRGHLVVVDVPHTADAFSVRYVSSANLDYNAVLGTIHPKYNMWVANLVRDIQQAAFVLSPGPESGTPGASAAPAADGDSAEARLRKLADLHDKGLITDEEYATRRQEIIDSL